MPKSRGLLLSLFPGMGMFDYAFELEGFTVVRGPDLIWGGDVAGFHPPRDRFDGVIGGPPCQSFSPIGNVNRARYGADSVMPDLIPEFARIVAEAAPAWYVMENSPYAYAPEPDAHIAYLNTAWLGEAQDRKRAFWSNLPLARYIKTPTFGEQQPVPTVTSKGSVDWKGSRARKPQRSVADMLELQGLPRDWLDSQPWTAAAKRKMIANGVPVPMGRAIAAAVICALAAP